jgi:hypothetical protein
VALTLFRNADNLSRAAGPHVGGGVCRDSHPVSQCELRHSDLDSRTRGKPWTRDPVTGQMYPTLPYATANEAAPKRSRSTFRKLSMKRSRAAGSV